MPLDFSIPLASRGIQFDDPFRTLGEARQRREEAEDRNLSRQINTIKMGQLRRKEQEQSALQRFLQETGGNIPETIRRARKAGVALEEADALEEGYWKVAGEQAKAFKSQNEAELSAYEKNARLLLSIKKPEGAKSKPVGAPVQMGSVWKTGGGAVDKATGGSAASTQMGSDTPEWKKAQDAYAALRPQIIESIRQVRPDLKDEDIPENYDPDVVQSLIERGLSYADYRKERSRAVDTALENIKLAKGQQELDAAIIKDFVAPFLIGAEPHETEGIFEGARFLGLSAPSLDRIKKATPEQLKRIRDGKPANLTQGRPMQALVDGEWKNVVPVFHPDEGFYSLPGHPEAAVQVRPIPPKATGGSGAAATKDDPKFPEGVKDWFNTLFDEGLTRPQARARIESALVNINQAHPKFDTANIDKWLNGAYGAQGNTEAERKKQQKELADARAAQKASQNTGSASQAPKNPPAKAPTPTPTPAPAPKKATNEVESIPGVPPEEMEKIKKASQSRITLRFQDDDGKTVTEEWARTRQGRFIKVR